MTNIIPFQFDSREVRVIADETGESLFVGKDVCETLGYANHNKAMGDHCKGVAKRYPLQTAGGIQELRVLTEADVLRLIVNSKLPAAEAFERWIFEEVLPTIRKTGSYTAPQAQPVAAIEQDLRVVGILADLLRVAPSGRITMAQVVLEQSAPHLLPVLPGYAVDAPPSAIVSGSSLPTASATDLLNRHGLAISAMKFNERLSACGMLEQQARTSRGNTKHYWSVTEKGSEFGKNITSNQNARETQPHWYVERFPDLLRTCFAS